MIGEEIGINEFLDEHSVKPIETDLGEYIIQLSRTAKPHHRPGDPPSKKQVADAFRSITRNTRRRPLEEPRVMLDEARTVLRGEFCPPRSALPAPTC